MPALEILGREARVLPATGQAIVDGVRPDIEELYDRATGGGAQTDGLWEKPAASLYREVPQVPRQERHLFKYFADGSTKTYFIGTILEHDRSSPVQLAQVGAAGVRREDDGRLRKAAVISNIALLLDKSALSGVIWEKVQSAAAEIPSLLIRDTSEEDSYSSVGGDEPRSRGAHKANWLMREAERRIAQNGLPGRSQDDWLVSDGSLGNEYLNWDGPPLIGVAKTFRRDSTFQIGKGPAARTLNLYSLLSGLEESHRTAVFPRRRPNHSQVIAFWYVRLRAQRQLDYPLMGVVKVEIPCPDGKPVDTEVADLISGALVAERSVTPHGQDSRWHAHLYPVWVAERVIRDSFFSEEVLKAAIRWPINESE
ncbi:MAG: hypothetical protein OXI41_11670 [Chloroflexota bacterium]|nr:hypothetical protein [Chloroflexota bacterium]MDE2894606.1 hypothetical protein [Chloroflexota bacterium]